MDSIALDNGTISSMFRAPYRMFCDWHSNGIVYQSFHKSFYSLVVRTTLPLLVHLRPDFTQNSSGGESSFFLLFLQLFDYEQPRIIRYLRILIIYVKSSII